MRDVGACETAYAVREIDSMKHCLLPVSQSVSANRKQKARPDAIDARSACATPHTALSRKSGERALDQKQQFERDECLSRQRRGHSGRPAVEQVRARNDGRAYWLGFGTQVGQLGRDRGEQHR